MWTKWKLNSIVPEEYLIVLYFIESHNRTGLFIEPLKVRLNKLFSFKEYDDKIDIM